MRIRNEAGIPANRPLYFLPADPKLKPLSGEYDNISHLEQALGFSPSKGDPFHGIVALAMAKLAGVDALSVTGDGMSGYRLAYRKPGTVTYTPVASLTLL
ncbi:hypothetical protein JW968_00990 [Candidatus Woesearchaeota archaeon]|nr:hypothetical protein [Candidatus Woesearchaeota archaeon]